MSSTLEKILKNVSSISSKAKSTTASDNQKTTQKVSVQKNTSAPKTQQVQVQDLSQYSYTQQRDSEYDEVEQTLFSFDKELNDDKKEVSDKDKSKQKEEEKLAQQELEDAQEEASKITQVELEQGYDEFVSRLKSAGLKTTSLGKNEVNFAEYAAALSDELKQEVIDSFDCEADYILQQEIAALFQNSNDVKNGDFRRALEAAGFEVDRKSVKTSYIIDDKKSDADGGGQLTNGSVTVFTVRDPETGAEIKIVDANGNGAIEVEELFMNELLTGISAQIDTSNYQKFGGVRISSGSASAGGLLNGSYTEAQTEEMNEKMEIENSNKTKVSALDYHKLLTELTNQYIENDKMEFTEARQKAKSYVESKYIIDSSASYIGANLKVSIAA